MGLWGIDQFWKRHQAARKWLTRLTPDKEITISNLQRDLRVSTRWEMGFARLAWLVNTSPTAYELAAMLNLAGCLQPGDTFVDVGANVGFFSAPLASIGDGVGFDTLAIEPHPRTFRLLQTNLKPYRRARACQLAASDRAGELSMVIVGATSGRFSVVRPDNLADGAVTTGRVRTVPCVRLDALPELQQSGPLVIKIDVEGHEAEVLAGLSGLIEAGRVRAILIDCFDDPAVPSRLTAAGFYLYDGLSFGPYRDQGRLLALRQPAALASTPIAAD